MLEEYGTFHYVIYLCNLFALLDDNFDVQFHIDDFPAFQSQTEYFLKSHKSLRVDMPTVHGKKYDLHPLSALKKVNNPFTVSYKDIVPNKFQFPSQEFIQSSYEIYFSDPADAVFFKLKYC